MNGWLIRREVWRRGLAAGERGRERLAAAGQGRRVPNVGAVGQTQRINDAMKAASQQFANAQKAAVGQALGGAGSALSGIFRLAGI